MRLLPLINSTQDWLISNKPYLFYPNHVHLDPVLFSFLLTWCLYGVGVIDWSGCDLWRIFLQSRRVELILTDRIQHSVLHVIPPLTIIQHVGLCVGHTYVQNAQIHLLTRMFLHTFKQNRTAVIMFHCSQVSSNQLVTPLSALFEMKLLIIHSCWMSGGVFCGWEATQSRDINVGAED